MPPSFAGADDFDTECIDCDDTDYPYETARSDIWALGLILIFMVVGRQPWYRATLDDADQNREAAKTKLTMPVLAVGSEYFIGPTPSDRCARSPRTCAESFYRGATSWRRKTPKRWHPPTWTSSAANSSIPRPRATERPGPRVHRFRIRDPVSRDHQQRQD